MTQPLSFRYVVRAYEPSSYGLSDAPSIKVDDFNANENLWDVVARACQKITAYRPPIDLDSMIVIETDNPDWGTPSAVTAEEYIPPTLHHRYPRASTAA